MIVGQRIVRRLVVVGISQSELARRVGMSQSAMHNLITGKSRSSTYLHKIARELQTTPAYMSGETDDPDQDAPPPVELDADTREMSERFAEMQSDDRRALLRVVRTMTGAGGSPTPVSATPEASVTLPSEQALAQMFEALLEGIGPKTSLIERAQLLAKRLPIGLSQLHDVLPDSDSSLQAVAGQTAQATPAKRHRVPQS